MFGQTCDVSLYDETIMTPSEKNIIVLWLEIDIGGVWVNYDCKYPAIESVRYKAFSTAEPNWKGWLDQSSVEFGINKGNVAETSQ